MNYFVEILYDNYHSFHRLHHFPDHNLHSTINKPLMTAFNRRELHQLPTPLYERNNISHRVQ